MVIGDVCPFFCFSYVRCGVPTLNAGPDRTKSMARLACLLAFGSWICPLTGVGMEVDKPPTNPEDKIGKTNKARMFSPSLSVFVTHVRNDVPI